MSQSERLTLRDTRGVFHLIGECRELGADSWAWREHMFAGLCQILCCCMAIGGEAPRLWSDTDDSMQVMDVGWGDTDERSIWTPYMNERFKIGPMFRGAKALSGHLRTSSRRQLVDDQEWYCSVDFNEYLRLSRIDYVLLSFYTVPGDPLQTSDWVTLHRPLGDRPFSLRDVRILRLFHGELGPLVGRSLATTQQPSAFELSPRSRQILQCLLEGDAEKQIAYRLGISKETVHYYVGIIYRHFQVQSRAELLAHWLRFARASSERPTQYS